MNRNIIMAVVVIAVFAIIFAGATLMGRINESAQHNNGDTMTAQQPAASQPVVATDEVEIEDYAYTPATITVKKGTTVTWTNKDRVGHNVVAGGESKPGGLPQDAPLVGRGETFSHTFTTVGTFEYICEPHPYMKGKVIVEE